MKILHLIHKSQKRGAEIFACQLAGHQKEDGHEVKIIAVYPGCGKLPWSGIIENIQGKENAFIDWKAWRRLGIIVKNFQPDIFQANSGDTLKYAVFSKKIFGWKTPVVVRNASEVGRYLKSSIQKRFNTLLYRNVTMIVSVSKASEMDLLCHFRFLQGKTEVIPVGLDRITTNPLILLPEDRNHIVHVGGFSFEKNHTGVISIFKKLLKLKPETHLHLVGDGELKQEIEQVVKYEQIEDKVSFYGYVNNPLDYIKAADVLVLPSIIEGLPGVLLEAMFCHTPVVAYDVGGIAEIVNDRTGSLVPAVDEEAFALAIFKILENRSFKKIENANKMVCENFMNETIAKKFIEVYKRILKEEAL